MWTCAQNLFSPPMFFHLNGRFEQAFVNSLLSASGANSSLYYWIGLMSTDDDGAYLWDHNTDPLEPLTYTNWNKHQPGSMLSQVCSSEINTVVVFGVTSFHVYKSSPFLFLIPVSGSGCVVMSGGPALGRWEVKNCRTFKALSLCKQSVYNDNDFQLPKHFSDPNAPCPPGWESHSELLLCFKVKPLLIVTESEYLFFWVVIFASSVIVSCCLDITMKIKHLLPIESN